MKKAILLAFLLTGCAGPQEYVKPIAEMNQQERCAEFVRRMQSGYSNNVIKMALYEKARNEGCMGQALPQTVIIR